jgi:hypothetical protein
MPSIWYPASAATPANVARGAIGITIDGGGATIITGEMGFISIPYDCTITKWRLVADQVGSIVIDVWRDTYGNFPPTNADSIAGTDLPTLSSAQKAESIALTGWTTSLSRGDVIGFNVDSSTDVQRVHLILEVNKSQ